jgi:hypothetical protein
MIKDVIVEIQGFKYKGLLDVAEQMVSIFNVVDVDDVDFLGRFWVEGANLIEFFPMTNRKVMAGKIISYS